jgi:hypothetical protein
MAAPPAIGRGGSADCYDRAMDPLAVKAFRALLLLVAAMAALLFIAAGTLDYWQAWIFLAAYTALSVAITLYLVNKDPELLRRRMRGGPFAEKETAQKVIMSLTSLGFIGLLVVPALDHRFGWSQMPPWLALAGNGLMALGWLGIYFVFRANWRLARESFQPALMRWSGIRCTPVRSSSCSAFRLRSVRGGACSSSSPSCPH